MNEIVVPGQGRGRRSLDVRPAATPRANACRWIFPSRWTSATSHSESALTTETPTP